MTLRTRLDVDHAVPLLPCDACKGVLSTPESPGSTHGERGVADAPMGQDHSAFEPETLMSTKVQDAMRRLEPRDH